MKNISILVMLFSILIMNQLSSQNKISSGVLTKGFIELLVLDSTDYNHEEKEYLAEILKSNESDENIYFNENYQIKVNTVDDSTEIKTYTDIKSGLIYNFYNKQTSKFYCIDSLLVEFNNDSIMMHMIDSLSLVFQKQRKESKKVLIMGYQCDEVVLSDESRNTEEYIKAYVTDDIGISEIGLELQRALGGYIMRYAIAVSNNLEAIIGIKKLEILPNDDKIFTLPIAGSTLISCENLNNKY